MSDQTIRRTDSIRVKLAPEMLERVEALAINFGMPTATLCAFAVATWVRQQEQSASLARMAVMDVTKRAGESFNMTDEKLEKVFGPLLAEVVKMQMLEQGAIPALDVEAAKVA